MKKTEVFQPVTVDLLAITGCSASVVLGLYDILRTAGQFWPVMTGEGTPQMLFDVRIIAADRNGVVADGGLRLPVHGGLGSNRTADVVIVPEVVVMPDSDPRGRWPVESGWLHRAYENGAVLCSACSGALVLAETGLLHGAEATSHWAVVEMLRRYYPDVRLRPQRVMVEAGPERRIITTGGSASWEDLALYLIRRFAGAEEAVRSAKVYLLGDRREGQLPFAAMNRTRSRDDAVIARCQSWLADHYAEANPVARMVEFSKLAERTFNRRFKQATGYTPVEYMQALRIEEAKQMLERSARPVEEISLAVGYDDPAFFRRLFKRLAGESPARYRLRFSTIGTIPAA